MASDADHSAQSWRVHHLDTVTQVIPDAIISINQRQQIIFSNPAAAGMFARPLADMIGLPLDQLLPQRYRGQHHGHIETFGASGVTMREMAGSMTVVGLRADGTEFPLEASISQVTIDGEKVFTVILRDVTLRVKADQELLQTKEKLRRLSARMRSVREEEQRHVARELHDDVGQRLSALRMDVAALRDALPADQPNLFDLIENMDELVGSTVLAVRRLATGLRPKILDELGLAPALETLLKDIESRYNLRFEIALDEDPDLSEQESIALFRIVQEAMHNIVKHADASQVWVDLSVTDDTCVLTIRDNGRGMTTSDEQKTNALGLTSMRERVMEIGGSLQVASSPNQGTRIECRLPLGQAPLSDDD